MQKSVSVSFLLLGVITLLCACGKKEHSTEVILIDDGEEAKAQKQMEICENRYGDLLEEAQWSDSFGALSLMKDELFTKASSVAYDYSNHMEGREISYDEETGRFRVLVKDLIRLKVIPLKSVLAFVKKKMGMPFI